VGIGGDPVHGTDFIDCLQRFESDPETDGIIMIGEIGGAAETRASAFVKDHVTKPVVGFIAGRTAPPGKRMGHAGAVISGGADTAEAKMEAMRQAGITVCDGPHLLGQAMKDALERRHLRLAARRAPPEAQASAAKRTKSDGSPARKRK
jgi:succinyl-CoA synthetase alpha subunit